MNAYRRLDRRRPKPKKPLCQNSTIAVCIGLGIVAALIVVAVVYDREYYKPIENTFNDIVYPDSDETIPISSSSSSSSSGGGGIAGIPSSTASIIAPAAVAISSSVSRTGLSSSAASSTLSVSSSLLSSSLASTTASISASLLSSTADSISSSAESSSLSSTAEISSTAVADTFSSTADNTGPTGFLLPPPASTASNDPSAFNVVLPVADEDVDTTYDIQSSLHNYNLVNTTLTRDESLLIDLYFVQDPLTGNYTIQSSVVQSAINYLTTQIVDLNEITVPAVYSASELRLINPIPGSANGANLLYYQFFNDGFNTPFNIRREFALIVDSKSNNLPSVLRRFNSTLYLNQWD